MAARLSALRTGRTLLPRNIIIFLFLVLISVRGWKLLLNSWYIFKELEYRGKNIERKRKIIIIIIITIIIIIIII
jgi:hypothetical protein